MKKLTIIIIVIVLLSITVTALSFNTKQLALDYFNTYKTERENTIKTIVSEIEFTSDKICYIEYHTESIYCELCYKYNNIEECAIVEESTTIDQDKDTIRELVEGNLQGEIPIEKVSYTKETIGGQKFDLEPKQVVLK